MGFCTLTGVIEQSAEEPLQNFCKEVIAWKNLRHPNVIPLLGAVMTENRLAMVSEWMANGNINQFVSAHQDVNRFELVSFPFGLLGSSTWVNRQRGR